MREGNGNVWFGIFGLGFLFGSAPLFLSFFLFSFFILRFSVCFARKKCKGGLGEKFLVVKDEK